MGVVSAVKRLTVSRRMPWICKWPSTFIEHLHNCKRFVQLFTLSHRVSGHEAVGGVHPAIEVEPQAVSWHAQQRVRLHDHEHVDQRVEDAHAEERRRHRRPMPVHNEDRHELREEYESGRVQRQQERLHQLQVPAHGFVFTLASGPKLWPDYCIR